MKSKNKKYKNKNKLREIVIKVIPDEQHRYDTVGDYWTDENGIEQIRVSDTGDWRYNMIVVLHEFVEDILCHVRGIDEKDITAFDINPTSTKK